MAKKKSPAKTRLTYTSPAGLTLLESMVNAADDGQRGGTRIRLAFAMVGATEQVSGRPSGVRACRPARWCGDEPREGYCVSYSVL